MKSSEELFRKVGEIFKNEPKLIKLSGHDRAVFVGDTHGDFDATKKVIEKYLNKDTVIVFLGDYVDRGESSKENIDFLLKLKIQIPERIFLLMGNHEGYKEMSFYPADFWGELSEKDRKLYGETLIKLPLAVSANGLVGLHGALPDLNKLESINKIKSGDENWFQIVWGDWQDRGGEYLGLDPFTGRPQFGRDYFDKIMKRFKRNILIRSHQPHIPESIFNKRCLTIFTSHAYRPERIVAIVNLGKKIKTTDDLKIEEI